MFYSDYVWQLISLVLLGYFWGGFPWGLMIVRAKTGIDLLEVGSGSIGATNVERVLGKKWGYIVQAVDALFKGALPIFLLQNLPHSNSVPIALFGAGILLGHSYSPYIGLRGGKSAATTVGIILTVSPLIAVACYLFWFKTKRKMVKKEKPEATAIASIRTAILMAVLCAIFLHDPVFKIFFVLVACHVIFAHRANIHRIKYEPLATDNIPTGCFMTDAASNDPVKIREHLARKYGFAKHIPLGFFTSSLFHLLPLSKLKLGEEVVTGANGKKARVIIWGFPWTPKQMQENPKKAIKHLVKLARYLEKRGAQALGLGAFTAIVYDKGLTLAESVAIPVTNGNRLTGGLAAISSLVAAEKMGWGKPDQITATVIGAGGSVGRACCEILLKNGIEYLFVVGRRPNSLTKLVTDLNIRYNALNSPDGFHVQEVSLEEAVRQSHVIIAATSSDRELTIDPSWLIDGAVITDMARPRNISKELADIMRLLPNDGATAHFDAEGKEGLGLPEGIHFPCLSELVLFLLEGWDFDWVTAPKLEEIELALEAFDRNGFEIAGLRLQEQPLSWEEAARRCRFADRIREGRKQVR
ncbi:MAG: glycerol-3-phosphate acyltransferase [Candidatus Berkelbacteria bacterium]|nr:glycerol-3-phosphate acyltransferase [Candidatus Berkelbacteria bacterium]